MSVYLVHMGQKAEDGRMRNKSISDIDYNARSNIGLSSIFAA